MSNYSAIYLSPHLDDAALSCGGQIFQRTQAGERVLIVSVTAGDPMETAVSIYAHSLHQRWELISDSVAGRRVEDKAACRILGADYLHWHILDCIYRTDEKTGAPFYVSDDQLFGPVHPTDQVQLLPRLAKQMQLLPSAKEIYVPLCIGHHVDHHLVRITAEFTFSQNILYYYEDYPYAQASNVLTTVIPDDSYGWQSKTVTLSTVDKQARIHAITAFISQLNTFFTDQADLEQQVYSYIAQVAGERIWYKTGENL